MHGAGPSLALNSSLPTNAGICMSDAACGHQREIFFFFISEKLLAFMGHKPVILPLSAYAVSD